MDSMNTSKNKSLNPVVHQGTLRGIFNTRNKAHHITCSK